MCNKNKYIWSPAWTSTSFVAIFSRNTGDVIGEENSGNHPRENNQKKRRNFYQSGQCGPKFSVWEVFGCQSPLNDDLVGTPIPTFWGLYYKGYVQQRCVLNWQNYNRIIHRILTVIVVKIFDFYIVLKDEKVSTLMSVLLTPRFSHRHDGGYPTLNLDCETSFRNPSYI